MKLFIFVAFFCLLSADLFSQPTKNWDCKLWDLKSFCDSNIVPGFNGFSCRECSFNGISCDTLIKRSQKSIVCLQAKKRFGKKLHLTSGFKNIRLISKNGGKEQNPTAIAFRDVSNPQAKSKNMFVSNTFSAREFHFFWGLKRKANLTMVFPEAHKGDIIVIDNYAQIEIK